MNVGPLAQNMHEVPECSGPLAKIPQTGPLTHRSLGALQVLRARSCLACCSLDQNAVTLQQRF